MLLLSHKFMGSNEAWIYNYFHKHVLLFKGSICQESFGFVGEDSKLQPLGGATSLHSPNGPVRDCQTVGPFRW